MKVAVSLSFKVALWLLLNLAVLTAAGALFVAVRYGVGWEAIVAGPAGERVAQLERLISAEFRANPGQSVDALLARYAPDHTRLYLFLNDGSQLGGARVTLPQNVRDELMAGPPRPLHRPPPGAGQRGPSRNFYPADDERPPPDASGPAGRPGKPAVFLRRGGEPPAFWIGLRTPVYRADEQPPDRGTLLLQVPSRFALVRLLDFGTWLLVVAVAFVISILCWLPFVGGLRRALLDIGRATDHIAHGQFETRLAVNRRDELGALSHSVNQMAGRLEAQVQTQKRFLGDVAHELGTPLARLQVAVELLEREASPALHRQIADVREEVEQVSTLVNELLAFTKAGLRRRDAALAPVNLPALIHTVLTRDDPASRVRTEVTPGVTALADAALLDRALSNLVRNALRYASDDAIVISVQTDASHVVINVSDAGPGVPAEALARLGEPFFRPDTARSRESGGTGLGLAIVRTCVESCRGSVAFRQTQPHGFTAEIRLARPA